MAEEVRKTAEQLATKQKDIGVAEFFAKNRHLLGFDNKVKALMTTIKEAVDNSLDACEEARILPEIIVEVTEMGTDKFKVVIEDNGPGIVKEQIGKIFARLLYGSKFHKLGQSLTSDQTLLVKKDGKVRLTTIGEFVDKYVSKEGEVKIINEGFEVPAFNPLTGKYAFMPVSKAIKHKQKNEIYEITLASGRKIQVTGCHSVFSLDQELDIKHVEARDLTKGSHILIPSQLPEPEHINSINIIDYIPKAVAVKQQWFVYGINKELIENAFSSAKIIHKKIDKSKSRKYYRINGVDVLDDSFKQYCKKNYLPVHLIKELNVSVSENAYIQTYYHGEQTKIPVYWPITNGFMRFLGFFVAEGHVDKRQAGFTFALDELNYVKEVANFAILHGINHTVEKRESSIRLKLFGGVISTLLESWCGKRAHNKFIPDFIFNTDFDFRQHFLDALYEGDGHNTKGRNQLMHSTVSKRLANELLYLWLFQGVVAHQNVQLKGGFGVFSDSYITIVYGNDIKSSHVFKTNLSTKSNSYRTIPQGIVSDAKNGITCTQSFYRAFGLANTEEQYQKYSQFFSIITETSDYSDLSKILNRYNLSYLKERGFINVCNASSSSGNQIQLTVQGQKLLVLLKKAQTFMNSDLVLQEIKSIEKLNLKNEMVYDISVPECENFVAGFGGISAHNSRGQQGIGISACVMYAQLTTGRATKITSKTAKTEQAHYMELTLDTRTNSPDIQKYQLVDWPKDHGIRIEMDMEASYQKGAKSIDEYLKETAITNPHCTIIYVNPKGEQLIFPRVTEEMPVETKIIKPHPYGIELGYLIDMLDRTEARTLQAFLTSEFSRVSPAVAKEICENAALLPDTKPKNISRDMAEKIMEGIKKTKIMAPPSDCLSPIGSEMLERGLRKEVNAEYYASISRPPSVYRGNPFIVEVAIAYGGDQLAEEPIRLMRFANRVPLLFQQGACAFNKSVMGVDWKSYGIQQSRGNLPVGPCTVAIHIASVWVPFTSESKEAIAHYPDIIKEVKLALQEVGRKLASYVGKKKKVGVELKKREYIQKYIPFVCDALKEMLALDDYKRGKIEENLKTILEQERGELDDVEFNPEDNVEFDESLAKMGKRNLDGEDDDIGKEEE